MLYSSANCGSGKTHSMIQLISINKNFYNGKVIFVQPKKENLLESEIQFKAKGMTPHIIDEDHLTEEMTSVAKGLYSYILKRKIKKTDVLLVTHQSFLKHMVNMGNITNGYHVVFDEVPQESFGEFTLSLSTNKDILLKYIQTAPSKNQDFFVLKPIDRVQMNTCMTTEGEDEINDKLRKFFEKLLNEKHYTVEIRKDVWESFKKNKRNGRNNVSFITHFYMLPEIFDDFLNVHFLSAKFEESDIYHIFKELGVSFVEKELPKLQYKEHENITHTFIRYCMERDFSKTMRSYKCLNQKTIIQNILDISRLNMSPDDKQLLVLNKDMIDGDFKEYKLPQNSELISSYVHGLNGYKHIHNITFAASLNYRNTQADFLHDRFGLSYEDIDKSFLFSSTYQAICRTSIRDKHDDSHRLITVPDYRSAVYVQEVLGIPDSRVSSLENFMFLPEQKQSGGQTKTHKQTKELTELKRKTKNIIISECKAFKDFYLDDENRFRINLLNGISTYEVAEYIDFKEPEDILDFFENESKFTSNDKHAQGRLAWCCLLLSDRNEVDGKKFGANNNHGYTCLMFDKDSSETGEDLSFLDCASWFRKQGWSFFMYETYSGKGNFRVVLPLKHVITCEAHELLTKWINKRISTEAGKKGSVFKWKEKSKGPFDDSKFNAAAKFYLPNHSPERTDYQTYRYKGNIFDPCKELKGKDIKVPEYMCEKMIGLTTHKKKIYERIVNPAINAVLNTSGVKQTHDELRDKKCNEQQEKFLLNKSHDSLGELVRKMTFWERKEEILPFVLMNYRNTQEMKNECEGWIKKYANMVTCSEKFKWK
nr:DEAD/DEAH box helicase family protein [Acetobacter pasteurianus]